MQYLLNNRLRAAMVTAIGLALLGFGSLALPVLAAGPFSNGGFETGTEPGVFSTEGPGSTDIAGWTVVSGTVDYIGTYWAASEGVRSIDLTGNAAGTISQTFATDIGAAYKVTFKLSGNPAGGPAEKVVHVSATGDAGALHAFDTSVAANSTADMKWADHTYIFIATAAETTLTFASQIDGFYGPALDDVVVTKLAYPRNAEITSPTDGELVYGVVTFAAHLDDDDADGIQWAVRKGTCAAGVGTVFGNVDGHSDVATIDTTDLSNQTFTFDADMSLETPGEYCFIYNPTEDGGETNIRLTRAFTLVAPTLSTNDPSEAFNLPGTKHTVNVVVDPVLAGVPIVFEVTGINEETETVLTDDAGTAAFTYTSDGTLGTDTITACIDQNLSGACDEGENSVEFTKHWLDKFVTGGGNIKEGRKVVWTFGGNVGIDEVGGFIGNFQIVNHQTKVRCHFNEVTEAAFSGSNTATFSASGMCSNSVVQVFADFEIYDGGEPGTTDTISVSGLIETATTISGGNFQVNTPVEA